MQAEVRNDPLLTGDNRNWVHHSECRQDSEGFFTMDDFQLEHMLPSV